MNRPSKSKLIIMHGSTWEDSAAQLREAHKNKDSKIVGLVVSEIAMRWKKDKIGNLRIIPLRRVTRGLISPGVNIFSLESDLPPDKIVQGGGKQINYVEPYSNLLFLIREDQAFQDFHHAWFESFNIGPAISTIMSFVMRCTAIGFNEFGTPLAGKADSPRLIFGGREWPHIWSETFLRHEGLRKNLVFYHPSPQEESGSMETMEKIYNTLMNQSEEDYNSLMSALRLYQLAHFVAREDKSLAYALLVAAIDSAARRDRGLRLPDPDPEGKITKAMEEVGLDENTQKNVKNSIRYGTLKARFSDFIERNLTENFWEGDYSIRKELEMLREQPGQHLRDLSEMMPEPERSEILKQAEEQESAYKEMKRQSPRLGESPFEKERREFTVSYLRHFLPQVLKDTYDCRSGVFHSGKEFPKKAVEGDIYDEPLVMIEEDIWKFMEKHRRCGGARYQMDKRSGKITRVCSCGNKKKVRMMLEMGVFERIVHDSIHNYISKLNTNSV